MPSGKLLSNPLSERKIMNMQVGVSYIDPPSGDEVFMTDIGEEGLNFMWSHPDLYPGLHIDDCMDLPPGLTPWEVNCG